MASRRGWPPRYRADPRTTSRPGRRGSVEDFQERHPACAAGLLLGSCLTQAACRSRKLIDGVGLGGLIENRLLLGGLGLALRDDQESLLTRQPSASRRTASAPVPGDPREADRERQDREPPRGRPACRAAAGTTATTAPADPDRTKPRSGGPPEIGPRSSARASAPSRSDSPGSWRSALVTIVAKIDRQRRC